MKNIDLSFARSPSCGNPYIGDGLNRQALLRMLARAKELSVDIHAFEVFRDNELKVRVSLPPYDCTDKRLYYSLSRSFTAKAFSRRTRFLSTSSRTGFRKRSAKTLKRCACPTSCP